MKLTIFNGSPRGEQSNSTILIEQFLIGYNIINSDNVSINYILKSKLEKERKEIFQNADIILIFFPLYTDCMPGIVKKFFEDIADLKINKSKKIGFIVQSGFPEAIHSTFVERYLNKFTKRLKCEYLGTVIKGGVEGIKIMPPFMTKKLFSRFQDLGEYFAKNECFSPEIKKKLLKPYKMSLGRKIMFFIFSKTGMANFYWNSNLKKNNAFEKRFDKPFV
ncbi:MAG: hypothetical protein DRJ01_13625 [Bacteroidetes bacterium]|nr:MAG: hypothetical protein DRJ01_13625 [Bacteroidota bacterium]